MLTGATTAELPLTTARVAAFAVAFLATAALWWLYFNLVAAIAQSRLAHDQNRTLLARDAYTYMHVVIVAGILLTAVGDKIVIAHPTRALRAPELTAVVCGPALYLLALAALGLRLTGTLSARRITGAVACVAVGAAATSAPALAIAGLLLAVLIAVIVADQIAAAPSGHPGERSRLERGESASWTVD